MKRRAAAWAIGAVVAITLIVGGIFLVRWGYDTYQRVTYPLEYEEYVTRYAAEYELPPSLVYAVIRTESHFDPRAVSSAGAKGLMQLMDVTYQWVQWRLSEEADTTADVFDPGTNIRYGCHYLQYCVSQFSDLRTAIAAYNAGVGRVSGWLEDSRYSDDGESLSAIPLEETRNYVESVLEAQTIYQTLYQSDREE